VAPKPIGNSARLRRAAIQGPSIRKANLARRAKLRGPTAERQLDFAELPSYIGYQVRRTQAAIFGQFETTLADFDLTPGSFGVLTLIKANPGITQVALAAAFGVDKSTMSPVIVRLEKRGLIRREVLPSDRRCHALFFEPAAGAYFAAARDKVRLFEEGLAARLTKAEQREFARLLAKLQG
jgi:DNA-binding MarR family transcriptional regulator